MHCIIIPCKWRYIVECFVHWICSFSFLLLNLRGVRTPPQKMIQRACVCKIEVFCRHIKDCVCVEFCPLQFFVLRIYYVLFSSFF